MLFFHKLRQEYRYGKKQTNRNKITDVNDKVVEIIKDDAIIGSNARLFLTDDYLIIKDSQSYDMMV